MKNQEIIKEVLNYLEVNKPTELEIKELIETLLYSIGTAILHKEFSSSEEVMTEYINNPTFGSALMAQALIMKDKWKN